MGLFAGSLILLSLMAMPVAGLWVAGKIADRREARQKLLVDSTAHLRPRRSWTVAYATEPHMESVFKVWSWEDIGVLHLYEDAVAFHGETTSFEVDRESVARITVTTYVRTNPLVPWLQIETTGGVRHFFCVPKGLHVFGMRERAEEIRRALDEWSRGSSVRPVLIE